MGRGLSSFFGVPRIRVRLSLIPISSGGSRRSQHRGTCEIEAKEHAASSAVKEIGEPGYGQACSLEDRFEGLGLENSLAMDGNGHAMREAVAKSAV